MEPNPAKGEEEGGTSGVFGLSIDLASGFEPEGSSGVFTAGTVAGRAKEKVGGFGAVPDSVACVTDVCARLENVGVDDVGAAVMLEDVAAALIPEVQGEEVEGCGFEAG